MKKLPINKILEKIFENINKKEIKSIVLHGSASRNELSVQVVNSNEYIISDIEICVFLKPLFLALKLKKKKIYIEIENYNIEILFTHIIFYKFLRTPLVYDLKTTGKILWGKDIRKSIWINNPKQIPLWEGVRLLYNRLIPFELLLWKYVNNLPITKTEEYYNTKLLIAIGEFLMIKDGIFFPSYKDKLNYLEKKFKKKTKIIHQITKAIRFKLNYEKNFDNLKLLNLTSNSIYEILQKLNPKLNMFNTPLSIRLIDTYYKIINRDFSISKLFFSNLRIINIYKRAYQLLKCFVTEPHNFLKYGKYIEGLYFEWRNTIEIQSSFI